MARIPLTLAAAGTTVVLLAAPAAACPNPQHNLKVNGPTNVYDPAYGTVKTQIRVTVHKNRTTVRLRVTGFPAAAKGKSFGAHVHVKPCGTDPAAAGGHYQHGTGSLRDKEIWLDFTVDAKGRASARAERRYLIDPGAAGSVVIHAEPTVPDTGAAGARLLCTSVPFGT
jgi:Cu-Zn family superoxide dismutase